MITIHLQSSPTINWHDVAIIAAVIGVIGALAAAAVGALIAYVFDIRRAERDRAAAARLAGEDRRRQRAAVATALIADLRALEPTLRLIFGAEDAASWRGTPPALFFDELRSEMISFDPARVYTVSELFRRVDDFFGVLGDVREEAARQSRGTLPSDHHMVRVKAGFCLQAFPAAKAALIAEGGIVPAPATDMTVVHAPALPEVPPPSFPDVAPPA